MASYTVFKQKIQRAEGGFQMLLNDKGNYNSEEILVGTNYGVSAKVYQKVIGRPPTMEDMQNITLEESHRIFKSLFWDKIKADYINSQAVAETFADHAINASPYYSTRIMQRVLNESFNKSLVVDGIAGNRTIQAINSINDKELFNAFSKGRKNYYNSLKDCEHFCTAWHGRVEELATDHKIDITKPISSKKKN